MRWPEFEAYVIAGQCTDALGGCCGNRCWAQRVQPPGGWVKLDSESTQKRLDAWLHAEGSAGAARMAGWLVTMWDGGAVTAVSAEDVPWRIA